MSSEGMSADVVEGLVNHSKSGNERPTAIVALPIVQAAEAIRPKAELSPYDFKVFPQNNAEGVLLDKIVGKAASDPEFDQFHEEPPGAIRSLAIYDLAEKFPLHPNDTTPAISQVTDSFLAYLSDGNNQLAKKAWLENIELRKCITDALLTQQYKAAVLALDTDQQNIIREARQLLRLPGFSFGSQVYTGTSTAALSGIEQAGMKLVSIKKQRELGIARRTGEGLVGSASEQVVREESPSVTTQFEVSDAYGQLNTDAFHQTPEKVQARLQVIQQRIAEWQRILNDPESAEGEHRRGNRNLRNFAAEQEFLQVELQQLASIPSSLSEEAPVEMIFGLKNMQVSRSEESLGGSNQYHSHRLATHEVDLKEYLDKLYVPFRHKERIMQWLSGHALTNIPVYAVESVRLIRDMDPIWEDARTTRDQLKQYMRSQIVSK